MDLAKPVNSAVTGPVIDTLTGQPFNKDTNPLFLLILEILWDMFLLPKRA